MTSSEADRRADVTDVGSREFDPDLWRHDVRTLTSAYVARGMGSSFKGQPLEARGAERVMVEEFYRDVAARGWHVINWPVGYGGMDASARQQAILVEELEYARLPQIDITITSMAPTIIRHGTEQNKVDWLDRMRSGEVVCAMGYSEPDAGTDLANLRTRAALDGDEWVINGQKIWNSGAHYCSHEWLAVRTEPGSEGHRGLSIIVVPIDTPGIQVEPLWTWADTRTNMTFFDNVRVPAGNLIGDRGQGWRYLVDALNHERAVIGARVSGSLRRLLDDVIAAAHETTVDGRSVWSREHARRRLAELEVKVDVAVLLGLDIAEAYDRGETPTIEGIVQKVFASELRTELASLSMELFGLRGQLETGDSMALCGGAIEHAYRYAPVLRFGGGTNEVMRDIIAQRGLGLPRSPRRAPGEDHADHHRRR